MGVVAGRSCRNPTVRETQTFYSSKNRAVDLLQPSLSSSTIILSCLKDTPTPRPQ